MKYRKDFVTNSSSSSFVCDICGRAESGWDLCLSEAEMVECVNGHTFCESEMLLPSRETMLSRIKDDLELLYSEIKDDVDAPLDSYSDDDLFHFYMQTDDIRYEMPEECCPICQFIEYSDGDLADYLEKEYKTSRDDVFQKVKAQNHRRKKLYDSEYIAEVCRQFDLSPISMIPKIKERFGSYKKFSDYIRG